MASRRHSCGELRDAPPNRHAAEFPADPPRGRNHRHPCYRRRAATEMDGDPRGATHADHRAVPSLYPLARLWRARARGVSRAHARRAGNSADRIDREGFPAMRSPDYYQGRADETRQIADCVDDPGSRRDLLQAAREWEELMRTALAMQDGVFAYPPFTVIRGGRPQ